MPRGRERAYEPMCPINDLRIVDGMTGNQILDTVLIVVASVFFIGAGVFLPFWEYTQGRGARRSRDRERRHHQLGVGAAT